VRAWRAAGREPVLVTGSGLYLRGVWDQLSPLPEVDPALVDRVRRWDGILGTPALHRYLAAVDPARAEALHPNDRARVMRALALHLATGQAPSGMLSGPDTEVPEGWRVLVVTPARAHRRDRVSARVAAQVRAGWPGEVAGLVAGGHGADLEALRPLGYAAWMAGGDPDDIQARVVQETQAYAKRQATWFRNQLTEAAVWDPDAEPLETAFAGLGLP
jgi:tRNA dimethylallyltransferase